MLHPSSNYAGTGSQRTSGWSMFERLRWLTILVAVIAVGLIEILSDTALDAILPFPWDTLFVMTILVILAIILSRLAFRRIDSLAAELAGRNAELGRRTATVRALHRVSVAISAISELNLILQAVVDQARELLSADGAIILLDVGADELALRAESGAADVVGAPGRPGGAQAPPTPGVSRLATPLQRAGQTIGSLVVGSRVQRSYGADELETLSSLANQAAVAVENARLQDRLRELAVAEERERIAREMHDGLAQVLGYVNTKSMAVEHLLDDGRVDEARSQLRQLAAAARSIYVDVREAILGLRSAIDPGKGLVQAIEEYADRFAEASKLVVEVRASAAARKVRLSPNVQSQVFRIVQESLTNVRKHANARRALVSLVVDAADLVLTIADDGRGIAAMSDSATDWPHYGLAAMRERAAAAGGTITWLPVPDGGTSVRLEVPFQGPALAATAGIPRDESGPAEPRTRSEMGLG